MRLEGIHHITAITGDAPANVDFYTDVLGLRMVAKTVNQDDPTVYHLFYADELGTPGCEITFFEYPGAPRGRAGAGMVHRIEWRVGSSDSLGFWRERLAARGVSASDEGSEVVFRDPEGLAHALRVSAAPDERPTAEHPEIPAEHALQGFDGVRAYSVRPEGSAAVLTNVLGASALDGTTFELRGERRGGTIKFDPPPAAASIPSAGTVHHIAWFSTLDDHPRWLEHLQAAGVANSGVIDRHYFRSIYFREPGGILYEIADDGPGFTRDLPLDELGTKVILPPWLETNRAEIEGRLTPLPPPRRRGGIGV